MSVEVVQPPKKKAHLGKLAHAPPVRKNEAQIRIVTLEERRRNPAAPPAWLGATSGFSMLSRIALSYSSMRTTYAFPVSFRADRRINPPRALPRPRAEVQRAHSAPTVLLQLVLYAQGEPVHGFYPPHLRSSPGSPGGAPLTSPSFDRRIQSFEKRSIGFEEFLQVSRKRLVPKRRDGRRK